MGDTTAIEWTDATLFGGPLPKRCSKCRILRSASAFAHDESRHERLTFVCRECRYVRVRQGAPGKRERQERRAHGLKWCSGCSAWMSAETVTKNGQCLSCVRSYTRNLYATSESFRAARRQHSSARGRGIQPISVRTMEILTDTFEGFCAYCDNKATTWDHVLPVSRGGCSRLTNIVPACQSCNSSKGVKDALDWIEATGRPLTDRFLNSVALLECYG